MKKRLRCIILIVIIVLVSTIVLTTKNNINNIKEIDELIYKQMQDNNLQKSNQLEEGFIIANREPYYLPLRSDIVPSLIEISYNWINEDTAGIIVRALIENNGGDPTPHELKMKILFTLKPENKTQILELPAIEAQAFHVSEASFNNTKKGNRVIEVYADSENIVLETDDNNNILRAEFPVLQKYEAKGYKITAAGEIDGDGRKERIVAAPFSNNGSGSIAIYSKEKLLSFYTGGSSRINLGDKIITADIDNDKIDEIIASSKISLPTKPVQYQADLLNKLIWRGDFNEETEISKLNAGGDINRDGIKDIAITYTKKYSGITNVIIYSGSGSGSYFFEFENYTDGEIIKDLNDDGYDDISIKNISSKLIFSGLTGKKLDSTNIKFYNGTKKLLLYIENCSPYFPNLCSSRIIEDKMALFDSNLNVINNYVTENPDDIFTPSLTLTRNLLSPQQLVNNKSQTVALRLYYNGSLTDGHGYITMLHKDSLGNIIHAYKLGPGRAFLEEVFPPLIINSSGQTLVIESGQSQYSYATLAIEEP